MTSLFSPKKPKPDQAAERAQRKAAADVDQQTRDETMELGARKRLIAARAGGNASLFSTGSAAGVKETLG
jgi:hypothetical protein